MPLAHRLAPAVAVTALALVPWLVWPGHEEPFSTPKRLAVAIAAGLLWTAALASRRRALAWRDGVFAAVCVAWIASFSASALLGQHASPAALVLGVAGAAWALAVARAALPVVGLLRVMLATATGIAVVALAQWLGADPLPAAGWTPELTGGSERLRVYATLGNPNFVAAWLAMHLPLAAHVAHDERSAVRRWAGVVSLAVLLAAVASTGSRGGALGAAAGLAAWALMSRVVRPARAVAAAAVLLGLLAWLSPARVLPETAAGRFYILMVAWPHAMDRPATGLGPGTFERHYPAWEQAGRRERRLPATLVHRFAGPQQHAHNDYVQALLERGVPGAVTFLLAIATPLLIGRRRSRSGAGTSTSTSARAVLAALAGVIVAIAATALVDFPFQRPAETFTFWTAAALLAAGHTPHEDHS